MLKTNLKILRLVILKIINLLNSKVLLIEISEILNGKLIYLSRSKFPKLEDNQFYLSDLIGFEII